MLIKCFLLFVGLAIIVVGIAKAICFVAGKAKAIDKIADEIGRNE